MAVIILLRTGSLVYTCSDHYSIIYIADTTLLVLTLIFLTVLKQPYMQLVKLPEIHSDHAIKFLYSVISKHEHECIYATVIIS